MARRLALLLAALAVCFCLGYAAAEVSHLELEATGEAGHYDCHGYGCHGPKRIFFLELLMQNPRGAAPTPPTTPPPPPPPGNRCNVVNESCTDGVTQVGPGGFCYTPKGLGGVPIPDKAFCCNLFDDGVECKDATGELTEAVCCSGFCDVPKLKRPLRSRPDGGKNPGDDHAQRSTDGRVHQGYTNRCQRRPVSSPMLNSFMTGKGVAGAISGETLVFSQAAQKLIPLKDLETGDHVPCVGSLIHALTLDGLTRWCEVQNYLVASPEAYVQVEVTLMRPDMSLQTVASNKEQLFYREAIPKNELRDTVPAVQGDGLFEAVHPLQLLKGDKVPIATHPTGPGQATVGMALVKDVRYVTGVMARQTTPKGLYKPAIDAPFMLVDGLVIPMFDGINGLTNKVLATSMGAVSAQHKLLAPVFTQHLQPPGTPAKEASWDGKTEWPPRADIAAYVKDLVVAADYVSLDDIHAWYELLMQAYADTGIGVSVAELQKVMMSPHDAEPDTAADHV